MRSNGPSKRQKEIARADRRRNKELRREQRKREKAARATQPIASGEDPDLAGIVPGPQPPRPD